MGTLSSSVAVPISAVVNTIAETWSVTFDQPLAPGPVNETQFDMLGGFAEWAADDAVASGTVVSDAMAITGLGGPGRNVTFVNAFNDFKDALGRQIADFQISASPL